MARITRIKEILVRDIRVIRGKKNPLMLVVHKEHEFAAVGYFGVG